MGHEPQSRTLPQPSPVLPHSRPCSAHVDGVHVGIVQVPATAPGCFMHAPPQQSAVVVHEPPFATHAPPHFSLPPSFTSGTQTFPQHSASVAQGVPTGTGVEQSPTYRVRHRGIPRESCRQQFSGLLLQFCPGGWPRVSQQLFAVLHESAPPTLQMPPGSTQPPPLPQRPYSSVDVFLTQIIGGPPFGCTLGSQPQQSLST